MENGNGNQPVLVHVIALFSKMNLTELWIEFRGGENQVCFPAHAIWDVLRS